MTHHRNNQNTQQETQKDTDKNTPAKAVIYCRVSSPRQVKQGQGLQSQDTRCREYAKARGYEVIETFHERAVSGGLLDRPAFNTMLEYIKQLNSNGIVVVIDDISRFARDIESHWTLRRTLKDTGGTLESPSIEFGEDSDSILIENLLASVPQHQRQKNAEQVKIRMRARALGGYWPFSSPPGYVHETVAGHGKLLVRQEPMASIIEEALKGFASGRFETQAEVKRYLESQPDFIYKTKKGEVRYEEVIRLLTRVLYAGFVEKPEWDVSLRQGRHKGLITLEEYERIQKRIQSAARAPARKDINAAFPLRGFITCADCDNPLTSCWSKSKTGKKHPYYMCFKKGCEAYRKSIRRDDLESAFEALLTQLQPSHKLVQYLTVIFRHEWDKRLKGLDDIKSTLRRELSKTENQIETLVNRIVDTSNTSVITAYEQKIMVLEKQKLIAQEKLQNRAKPQRTFDEMFELALNFLSNPCKLWHSEHLEDKRTVLKLAFEQRLAYCRNEGLRTPKTALPFNMLGDNYMGIEKMAERKGFEPSIRSPVYSLSRGAPSTTRPPLRGR